MVASEIWCYSPEYIYIRKLGTGVTSQVDEYFDRSRGIRVCIKEIPLSRIQKLPWYQEVTCLQILNNKHPSLLKFYDAFTENQTYKIITEVVQGVSLRKVLDKGSLSVQNAKIIFYKLVDGVNTAHKYSIVHRDLKPSHIYVHNHTVKIIDWGYALSLKERKYSHAAGTPIYAAPEILSKPSQVSVANDVWSLGIILHLMLSGVYPIQTSNKDVLFQRISNYEFVIDSKISFECQKLLKKILVPLEDRVTCEDILKDPWFSDLNEDLLENNGGDD